MKPENIAEVCMMFYSPQIGAMHTRERLEDKFPRSILTPDEKTTYTPQAYKPKESNIYTSVPEHLLGRAYTMPKERSHVVPPEGMALLKNSLEGEPDILIYASTPDVTTDKIKSSPELGRLLNRLEYNMPALNKKTSCAIYNSEGAAKAEVLMENGNFPAVLRQEDKEYYPVIQTNATCCYSGGNFTRANGDCSGAAGILKAKENPELVMLRNNAGNYMVYMSPENNINLMEIRNPDSELRYKIKDMHERLRLEKT
ncbi:MAG: hypothetical protein ACOCZ6_01375 [Nanoarchaeota archaeon]